MQLSEIEQKLSELAREKAQKWESETVEDFPDFTEMRERVVIGDFSMVALASKQRWIAQDIALNPFDVWQTPTEIVRHYLSIKYTFPLLIRAAQAEKVSIPRAAPLLARIGYHGYGVYADICSAYWQIVRAVGWDVEYFPNRYVCKQSSNDDMPLWLAQNKPARSSLVSLSRPASLSVWTGEKLIIERTFNQILNMRLVALVHDVLMAIASEVKHYCKTVSYINTDGYVIGDSDYPLFCEILREWGLEHKQKAYGKVRIFGVGAYQVGRFKSKSPQVGGAYDNIDDVNFDWMRRNFAPFAMGTPLTD